MRTATLSEEHVREALPGRAAQGATWMSPTQKKAQEAQHPSLLPSGRPIYPCVRPAGYKATSGCIRQQVPPRSQAEKTPPTVVYETSREGGFSAWLHGEVTSKRLVS